MSSPAGGFGEGEMDKRKLRLILLGIVGIIILVIGIGAANIYIERPISKEVKNEVSQAIYGKNYDELNDYAKAAVDSLLSGPPPSMQEKNAQFRQWLVKWVVIPFCVFLILTAALVASRVILNKSRPPPGPS
jgi:hypothetical protein